MDEEGTQLGTMTVGMEAGSTLACKYGVLGGTCHVLPGTPRCAQWWHITPRPRPHGLRSLTGSAQRMVSLVQQEEMHTGQVN
jgi:hypothetical protein